MPRKKGSLVLPVIPLRGFMVFPHMMLHFDVGRPASVAALEQSMANDQMVFLVAQKDSEIEDPKIEDLYTVGTIAEIKQLVNLPGDVIRVLAEGRRRAELALPRLDPSARERGI